MTAAPGTWIAAALATNGARIDDVVDGAWAEITEPVHSSFYADDRGEQTDLLLRQLAIVQTAHFVTYFNEECDAYCAAVSEDAVNE